MPTDARYASRNAEIVRRVKAGESLERVGRAFRLSEARIAQIVRQAAVMRGEQPVSRAGELRARNAEVVRRRDAGETFTEIAHDLGLSSSRVQQIYRREEERAREVADARAARDRAVIAAKRGRWMDPGSLAWLVQELRRAMDDADWGRVQGVLIVLGEHADMQIGE